MAKNTKVTIQKIPLNKIKLGKNSRMSVSPDELQGLMESIKETGLLQPIGVIRRASGFEICYGNRRFLAVSKLGMSHIPAVVHDVKKESDVDLKNLTENVQRRNLSLTEIGRYVELLRAEKLTSGEIAVRLGVTKHYVETCLESYKRVPKEFRNDLEVQHTNQKRTPGKISITTARGIVNATKNYDLPVAEARKLYKAAKEDDRFNSSDIPKYAAAIKRGNNNFIETVRPTFLVQLKFQISEPHKNALMKEYVNDGPFNSLSGLLRAILKGEKNVKIDVLD
jgi:ParB/RepB/Spo0J family partition protein